MPTIENQSLSKLYYSIGEVAEHLQVNASLLRFWEKEFNLAVSKKNKKGNRLYTVKEIEKIQRIYQLVKVEGYTLDGAKKALKVKVEPHLSVQNEVVAVSSEANTLDIRRPDNAPHEMLILSLGRFRRVVKDYFAICDSYYQAIRKASAAEIETIDMARRGVHNEAAELLMERLEGKVEVDFATARRLFTLICVLHIKS
jgi:DNA-binding transcriptional MerR regulator